VVVGLLGAELTAAFLDGDGKWPRRLRLGDFADVPLATREAADLAGRAAVTAELAQTLGLAPVAEASARLDGLRLMLPLVASQAVADEISAVVALLDGVADAPAVASRPVGTGAPVDVVTAVGGATPARPWAAFVDDELRVEVPEGSAETWRWARVFSARPGAPLLVGLAPVEGATARLLVPPGGDPAELLVDLTDDPSVPRPSAALMAFRRAVAAGRRACRAERHGDDEQAGVEWRACSEAWSALGDGERAQRAASFVSPGPAAGSYAWRSGRITEPLPVDRWAPPEH
jgi:hypothetical protein